MKDIINVSGSVLANLFVDGKLVKSVKNHNLILYAGENYLAGRLSIGGIGVLSDIAIGIGIPEPLKSDETLFSEVAREKILTGPTQGTGNEANTVVVEAFFREGIGTGDIREAGLLYDSMLFARTLFTNPIDKTATASLQVIWTVKFSGCV